MTKSIGTRTAAFMTMALLVGSLFLGFITIAPAAFGQAYTFTASSTTLGAKNVIEIEIDDPDITDANEDGDLDATEAPTVTISYGSNEKYLYFAKKATGEFVAYIANATALNSPASLGGTTTAGTGTDPDNYVAPANIPSDEPTLSSMLNSDGDLAIDPDTPDACDNGWPLVQVYDFEDEEEATLTFAERGATLDLTLGDTGIDITGADRITPPPDSIIYIVIDDITKNLDPTAADECIYYFDIRVNGDLDVDDDLAHVEETGDNTGIFELWIDLDTNKQGPGTSLEDEHAIAPGDDDVVTVEVFDSFYKPTGWAGSFPVPDSTAALGDWEYDFLDLTLTSVDGNVEATTDELTYVGVADGVLTYKVVDSDQNLDTESEEGGYTSGGTETYYTEYVTVGVEVDDGTTLCTAWLVLWETDEDTGEFEGTVELAITSGSEYTLGGTYAELHTFGTDMTTSGWGYGMSTKGAESAALVVDLPVGDGVDIRLIYDDPASISTDYEAEFTISSTTTLAIVSFDEDTYSVVPDILSTITINEPDANDDPDRVERLTLTAGSETDTTVLEVYHANSNANIGNLTISIDDGATSGWESSNEDEDWGMDIQALATTEGDLEIQLVETGSNTGIFQATFNLQNLYDGQNDDDETDNDNQLEGGEDLTITYTDYFDDEVVDDTASIGGTVATLTLDRAQYGVMGTDVMTYIADDDLVVHVTLTDQDENDNAAMKDSATAYLVIINATGDQVTFDADTTDADSASANSLTACLELTLTESDRDTGIFEVDIKFEFDTAQTHDRILVTRGSGEANDFELRDANAAGFGIASLVDQADMIGGKIRVYYEDPLSDTEDDYDLDDTDEEVVMASATVRPHTTVMTVSSSAPSINDTVTVSLTDEDFNLDSEELDTVTVTILVDDDDSGDTLDLEETGEDTGIFEAEFQMGVDAPAFDDGTTPVQAGSKVTFNFTDTTTAVSTHEEGLVTDEVQADATAASHTVVITLDSDAYSPFGTATITVYDPDLILYATSDTEVQLARVNSGSDPTGERNVTPATKEDDGSFTYTVELWVDDTDLEASIKAEPAAADNPVEVDNDDTITAYFVDTSNAAGDDETISTSAAVRADTGLIEMAPATLDVGDTFTITLTDLDANVDTGSDETVTVVVSSDTWPQGQNVVLEETGEDTHIFVGDVIVTDEIPTGNEVWADIFDTITVEYTDPYDADGEEDTVISATIRVGIVPEFPVPAAEPAFVDAEGNAVTAITTGDLVVVEALIENTGPADQDFAYLVQIKDAGGVVVQLAFVTGTLEPGQSITPGVSWIPTSSGDYTVEVFVWESLTTPEALSEVQISAATVT